MASLCFVFWVSEWEPEVDKFNLVFQNKQPVLYRLQSCVSKLLQDILIRFIQPKVLQEMRDVTELDFTSADIQLADENILLDIWLEVN